MPQTPAGGATLHPPRRSSSVLSHDGTSELYATVGETPLPEESSKRNSHYAQIRENPIGSSSGGKGSSSNNIGNMLPVVNGVPPGPSSGSSAIARSKGIEATPSSDSETYATASLHHPYAKLKKNHSEHPYAKVRPPAGGPNLNDEETDTDNYDLPQFLMANTRQPGVGGPAVPGSSVAGPSSSQNRLSSSGAIQNAGCSGVGGVIGSSADAEGPVPPRRIGRQWRRSSQPQVLNNDNASHFSGDSQDSRGYTSISVREPLSNIRNQVVANTRNYDSHYATVSDDSEEMYAAIDDPNDSNYMRIPGDNDNNNPRRPTWLGGPNVASPIPERREANSPLPPVPNVPPPELSPGQTALPSSSSAVIPPPSSPTSHQLPPQVPVPAVPVPAPPQTSPPVYAQVTKKKKQPQGKTPVTPTASNASTSSSQQIMMREAPLGSEAPPPPPPMTIATKESSTSHHHSSSSHHPHHRSKRAASLMDNSNPMDADTVDSRRWSKADISYSEFEVVRESIFPSSGTPVSSPVNDISNEDSPHHHLLLRSPGSGRSDTSPPSSSAALARPLPQDLVDEDNYNIIPDKTGGRSSRQAQGTSSTSVTVGAAGGSRIRLDSGNYHEIEPRNLNNTYQEIGGRKEPSDHYQEIGDHRRSRVDDDDDDDDGGDLYQVIDKKKRNSEDEDDEEEEEEDQFYEKVKKPGSKGKKHGYEKIKKKDPSSSKPPVGNLSRVIPAIGSDEDEEDDDDKPDQMYESVKYPPYERLKESKDDLVDSEDGKNGSDYYEDIGYSRVKPKKKPTKSKTPEGHHEERDSGNRSSGIKTLPHPPLPQDVSQLYAQVDKTKKRTKKVGSSSSSSTIANNSGTISSSAADNTVQQQDISGNNNEPFLTMPLYSKVNKASKNKSSNKNTSGIPGQGHHQDNNHVDHHHGQQERRSNDNSIEYI